MYLALCTTAEHDSHEVHRNGHSLEISISVYSTEQACRCHKSCKYHHTHFWGNVLLLTHDSSTADRAFPGATKFSLIMLFTSHSRTSTFLNKNDCSHLSKMPATLRFSENKMRPNRDESRCQYSKASVVQQIFRVCAQQRSCTNRSYLTLEGQHGHYVAIFQGILSLAPTSSSPQF